MSEFTERERQLWAKQARELKAENTRLDNRIQEIGAAYEEVLNERDRLREALRNLLRQQVARRLGGGWLWQVLTPDALPGAKAIASGVTRTKLGAMWTGWRRAEVRLCRCHWPRVSMREHKPDPSQSWWRHLVWLVLAK
jgi:hypothetical protein